MMNTQIQPFDLQQSPLIGRNLIEASAGTGKTFTIEGIYLRLLVEKKMEVEHILVVTFTEAATSELRERIRNNIRTALGDFERGKSDEALTAFLIEHHPDRKEAVKNLKAALTRFDEARIFTIHGFCHRVLLDHAFESGSRFDTEFIKDQGELLLEIVQDFWRQHIYTADDNWTAFLMSAFEGPHQLLKKYGSILTRPVARIIPDLVEPIGSTDTSGGVLPPAARRVESLYADLSHNWADNRDRLEEVLITHPGLSHKSYSKRFVPKWMRELDQYLEVGNPFTSPKNLFRFTRETVTSQGNGKEDPPGHPVFNICSELASNLDEISIQLVTQLTETTRQELTSRKRQQGLISFDDLLFNLRDALKQPAGDQLAEQVRNWYQVALIDEFQDTDPIQFEIFNTIFSPPEHPLFFIGDPKQSIYSFRGADIFAYLEAQELTEHPYTLCTNWRSDRDLIQAINTIFSFRTNPFLFQGIDFIPSSGTDRNPTRGLLIDDKPDVPFHLWTLIDEEASIPKQVAHDRVTEAVATEIARLLNLGQEGRATILEKNSEGSDGQHPLFPEHIAVLVRVHKEAEAMQQALRRLSVPSIINTRSTIYESQAFSDIITLLKAVGDPSSEKQVRRALVTDLMGVSGEQLFEYLADENRWEAELEKFQTYRRVWLETGFYAMVRLLTRQENIRTRLLRKAGGERLLTNFLHALELLHDAQNRNKFGINGLLKWAERQLTFPEKGTDDAEIRLETDDRAVQIMTVHAAKGLEFPVVFVPFAWGARRTETVFFHDADNANALTLDLGSAAFDTHKAQAQREGLAEEIRLLYVALTRARHRCYLIWGDINQTADAPPAWLFHEGHPKPGQILDDLRVLEQNGEGHIQLQQMPEGEATPFTPEPQTDDPLQCLTFKGNKTLDWGISSFTKLSTRTATNSENPDRDRIRQSIVVNKPLQPHEGLQNMFSLPGGAKTGNCFHELFEHLDFRERDPEKLKEVVEKTLKKYDFEEQWQPVALELIRQVLSVPLIREEHQETGFSLGELDPMDRISEMEFFFPLQQINSADLSDILKPHLAHRSAQLLQKTMEHLDFNEIPGFMKGFIDLIFHHQGRYYIVDWKTNFLGSQLADYHEDYLQEYMISHSFILQYMVYSVALHRMLQLKLKNYQFTTHFGGIAYFFLRGIQKETSQPVGIFRDNLEGCGEMIEDLSQYLGGHSEGGQ